MEPFNALLRRFRARAGLTLSELAEAVGADRKSVRLWEQGKRVPRDRARLDDLAQALKLSSAEATQFAAAARQHSAHPNTGALERSVGTLADPYLHVSGAGPASAAKHTGTNGIGVLQPRHSLPSSTIPLFGRDADLATLEQLVQQPHVRLVTLRGPGGVGKTRLALALARRLQSTFAAGALFVDLAPLRESAHVLPAIAQALGLLDTGSAPLLNRLQTYLRDCQLLLVLDNFEHVLPAASELAELAAATPQVVYLVTSRRVLALSHEHEWSVEPLPLPDLATLPGAEQLIQAPAIACFLARAQAIQPSLILTPNIAPVIAAICTRLDGLPLAIELAAARLRLFTPAELLHRLEQPLPLLASSLRDQPARHATLRATTDWSYILLTTEEQMLFARLAIFVGGCGIEAVEAVCAVTPQEVAATVGGLESLAAQSLITVVPGTDGTSRIHVLETLREYAQERLAERGEAATMGERHALYYAGWVEQAATHLTQADQRHWLDRLDGEHHNIQAALRWLLDTGNVERALALIAAIWPFWQARGHYQLGRAWAEATLESSANLSTVTRGMVCYGAGWLAHAQGDQQQAAALFAEALRLGQTIGDTRLIAQALHGTAQSASDRGDFAQAMTLLEQSLALFQTLGDRIEIAWTYGQMCSVALGQGENARSLSYCEVGLQLFREAGHQSAIAFMLAYRGWLLYQQGNNAAALTGLQEGLVIARVQNNIPYTVTLLNCLGQIAIDQLDIPVGLALVAESIPLQKQFGQRQGEAGAYELLGWLRLAQGDSGAATMAFIQALQLAQATGSTDLMILALSGLGRCAEIQGQLEQAAWRYGHAAGSLSEVAHRVGRMAERAHAVLTPFQARLTDTELRAAWERGLRMPLAQACKEVLADIKKGEFEGVAPQENLLPYFIGGKGGV